MAITDAEISFRNQIEMPSTVDKLEKEALEWLELVIGEQFDENKNAQETLKDGTILCKAFNACFSDMKVKYTCSAMPFKQMENIATFLHALSKLPNFRSFDLFSTVDLYEGKNMAQVVRCVLACKRIAEREAVIRGIEVLKVNSEAKEIYEEKADGKFKSKEAKDEEKIDKKNKETKDEESIVEIMEQETSDDFMEVSEPEIKEAESFDESEAEHNDLEDEKMEIDDQLQDANASSSSIHQEPEIIFIDSPVFADDESEDHKHLGDEEEEYETFTQENPGTFEIQVSN